MSTHRMDRRRFIKYSTSAAALAMGSQVFPGVPTGAVSYPRVDLHVHLSQETTFDKLAEMSKATGFKYGIVEHPGPRYSAMSDDKSLNAYLDRLSRYDFFKGLQPVDPGWRKLFSAELLTRLDYVLMDAMEIPKADGGYEIIWRDDFKVEDEAAFMDRYVEFNVRVLGEEKPNILASATFLPKSLRSRYDELWTDARMEAIIKAAVGNHVALEINSLYKIPNRRFVEKARQMGAQFSFGTNGRTSRVVGNLEYSFELARQCNLSVKDIYVPVVKA